MQTKSCRVAVKAAGPDEGLDEGVFEALVSVFGNKDSYGDVVLPGAFTATLAEWEASGAPIPVYWSHRMDDPDYNIGHVLEAKETADGLWVKAQIDLESPKAANVFRLLKGKRVTQFSFAYDVISGAWVKNAEDEEFYELRELKLYEVGPTPIGANQETELLSVKSMVHTARALAGAVKAGRAISAKNETTLRESLDQITEAASAIKSVLAVLEPDDEADGKATAPAPGKDEGPAGVKSEDRARAATADLSELDVLDLELSVSA